jgi:hypothetical protein
MTCLETMRLFGALMVRLAKLVGNKWTQLSHRHLFGNSIVGLKVFDVSRGSICCRQWNSSSLAASLRLSLLDFDNPYHSVFHQMDNGPSFIDMMASGSSNTKTDPAARLEIEVGFRDCGLPRKAINIITRAVSSPELCNDYSVIIGGEAAETQRESLSSSVKR